MTYETFLTVYNIALLAFIFYLLWRLINLNGKLHEKTMNIIILEAALEAIKDILESNGEDEETKEQTTEKKKGPKKTSANSKKKPTKKKK